MTPLVAAEVDALERAVAVNPSDVAARERLLRILAVRRLEPDVARRRLPHILWVIEHAPAHPLAESPWCYLLPTEHGYKTAAGAWELATARSSDPVVMRNAARFFSRDEARCRALLERGQRLAPTWSMWDHELGDLVFRRVRVARTSERPKLSSDQIVALAREALGHFKRALALVAPDRYFGAVCTCAEAAVEAAEHDAALRYADETLAIAPRFLDDRRALDYQHAVHVVRGHVALTRGDVAAAIPELLRAANVGSDSPPLMRSFGPDFHLANRLLAAGEVDAVVVYLDRCAGFWDAKRVAGWRDQLARGERPFLTTTPDLHR